MAVTTSAPFRRRLPVGAEVDPDGRAHFRVWAPERRRVRLRMESPVEVHQLGAEGDGYFSTVVPEVKHGTPYRFLLDDDETGFPDPASRWQPDGPHGPSAVIDPARFRWTDEAWPGVDRHGQVIYELHIGTFTREGTWSAAARELPALAGLGVTVIEVMPVADFPGRFGWGYDGVNLFAPSHLYGTPDDFRQFVDDAHGAGLGVILDVVYNHVGPSGNYLDRFSPHYFTDRYRTDWGSALNFDGDHSDGVRTFFIANAGYWIDEFHLDGLRLDATHSIFDESDPHILREIGEQVRSSAKGRHTLVVNENEPQDTHLLRPTELGGFGHDMLWNDDWHHSTVVALTGRSEAFYSAHRGHAQEFVSVAKHGTLYQGQVYYWQRKRRGTPTAGLSPEQFVNFLQNHDQIANSASGLRMHLLVSPARYRAMTALLLLGPQTPMLFMGQEFASNSPFHYFADHEPELAALVHKGRREFLSQFASIAQPDVLARIPAPHDTMTFESCRLDFSERDGNRAVLDLHRDLLRLRREDPCFSAQRLRGVDGAVLSESAFVLRFFGNDGEDRLLLVNLGPQLNLPSAPEPLLAPPEGKRWHVIWTSEDSRFGGQGTPPADSDEAGWQLLPDIAVVLAPIALTDDARAGERRKQPERRRVSQL